ncbi:hypothetical protein AMECASPLE_034253 [Ameca splendens]|uniref:Uncharacterized protein n=1 Tax=Ameca splendens TaxID=208324 RepID=A0ABV0XW72_9TELE
MKKQNKLKLQAALKALARQRNSDCEATTGAWHRWLQTTNEAAAQFQMLRLGGAVSVMSDDLWSYRVLVLQKAFQIWSKSDLPDGSCTHLFLCGRGYNDIIS